MDSLGQISLSFVLVFFSFLECCHGYCYGYCGGYSWWSMWYIWLVIVTLLLICCGAGGALWRRRHAQRLQATTIVTSGQAPAGQPYNMYGVQPGTGQVMTPPAYNTVVTGTPGVMGGVNNMAYQPGLPAEEKKENLGSPPAYTEAVTMDRPYVMPANTNPSAPMAPNAYP